MCSLLICSYMYIIYETSCTYIQQPVWSMEVHEHSNRDIHVRTCTYICRHVELAWHACIIDYTICTMLFHGWYEEVQTAHQLFPPMVPCRFCIVQFFSVCIYTHTAIWITCGYHVCLCILGCVLSDNGRVVCVRGWSLCY